MHAKTVAYIAMALLMVCGLALAYTIGIAKTQAAQIVRLTESYEMRLAWEYKLKSCHTDDSVGFRQNTLAYQNCVLDVKQKAKAEVSAVLENRP